MERSTSVQNQVEEATPPVISQGLENMSVQGEETLQTNTDPTELDECGHSSATESALSGDGSFSAFDIMKMYKHVLTGARDPGASREDYSHSNEDLSEETDSEVEGNAKLTREIIRMMAELERRSGGQSTSRNTLAMRRATCRKRRCNSDDDDDTSDDERVLPTKRRATRDIVVTNSGDERQLPFEFQLRVVGVTESGSELETSDDEGPMTDDDPLEAEAWFRYHCERATRSEATGAVSKTEPTDDDNLNV